MLKKKLKIAIFHLAFIYSGGGERLVLEEAKGLKEKGHSVEIFTSVLDKRACFPDTIGGFNIRTFLPDIPFIFDGHESFKIVMSCILAPLFAIKFRKFDVILAANQPSLWIAWVAKRLFSIPYVSYLAQPTRFLYMRKIDKKTGLFFSKKASDSFTAMVMHKAKRFIYWADKISIKSSNVVLANGDYIKAVLEKTYSIKAISCPAGAYPTSKVSDYRLRLRGKIAIGPSEITKPYLLLTNRHFSQKRFEYAVFALVALLGKYPNYSLVVAGKETDYTNEVKRLVARLDLTSKVKFLGYVKEKELNILYSNAAVYLYTAPEEDFGMGVIEAMAKGTPVVAWNNAGPTGIVRNGIDGLLAKPFETSDFSQKVLRIASNNRFAQKVAQAGLESVKKRFTYEKHLKTLEGQLKSVGISS
ncbi:hypothetical protein A2115_01455 [Candidatus Woesebacteria bacterium GWA1_41_8]|uniref:GDP-Man:Man(1)GlcNAc(2)-PP-Dol alpha-1,3-mannosyltransferase n=1 Tax=Candidatus Woesebacteria bacterium GWA1_41_8 TaxID=1802471 RepID=A0A1F7WID0_9BACT|nr:MAG: hypothetical protein A2115_01455 [Candidatus Woesebacteria bacterium GWA1_41_8]